jgi:CheY-like chemotaxis protein
METTGAREAQRTRAVGELACAVAHDLNNVLGAILAYCALLQRDLGPGHAALPRVDKILGELEDASRLTRELLEFSRDRERRPPQPLELSALVREREPLLERLVGEAVELEVAAAEPVGLVNVEPADLEQILVNLALNARDAMPSGGRLRIETALVDLREGDPRRAASLPGRYAMIAVADSGVGMDPATQRRVFEPFFTTKPQGKGTGLGLATVQAVAKARGGFVGIHSVPGLGSTFKVYLPVCEAAAVSDGALRPSAEPSARGDETLLVVEDAVRLRETFREALQPQGYTVLGAADGREALQVAREHHGPIHLLVTDVVMPRLGGVALARELRRRRPEVRVLYMSGHAERVIAREIGAGRAEPLIRKPFTTARLRDAVRRALDRPSASAPDHR